MHTIPEYSMQLGCSPQALHKAKKRAETLTGSSIQGVESTSDKRKILYTLEQLEQIKGYLNLEEVQKRKDSNYSTVETTVIEGNHCESVGLATIPQNYSLENFHSGTTRLDLNLDPDRYLQSLTSALTAVDNFMTQAEQSQRNRLNQIQDTNRLAKQELDKFKERKLTHQFQTEIMAQLQNSAIADFQSTANQIQDLGIMGNTTNG